MHRGLILRPSRVTESVDVNTKLYSHKKKKNLNKYKGKKVELKIAGHELRTRVNRKGLLKTKGVRQSLGVCTANCVCVLNIPNEGRTDQSQMYDTYMYGRHGCYSDVKLLR
jgi:hypothetical protein